MCHRDRQRVTGIIEQVMARDGDANPFIQHGFGEIMPECRTGTVFGTFSGQFGGGRGPGGVMFFPWKSRRTVFYAA
jgi:hypothetical protein